MLFAALDRAISGVIRIVIGLILAAVLFLVVVEVIYAFLQALAAFGIVAVASYLIQLGVTFKNDPRKLIDVRFNLGLGIGSLIGAVPMTDGLLKTALAEFFGGAFLTGIIYVAVYFYLDDLQKTLSDSFVT